MAKKTAKKIDKNDPKVRKRHYTYLFWATVVIAASIVRRMFPSYITSAILFGVSVLALYMLLRMDSRFMRVHKAFRTASSIETAKIKKVQEHNQSVIDTPEKISKVDAGLANANLNKKHGNKRNMVQD
jgi:hypothetical protein